MPLQPLCSVPGVSLGQSIGEEAAASTCDAEQLKYRLTRADTPWTDIRQPAESCANTRH